MACLNNLANLENHFSKIVRIRDNAENALKRAENFIKGPEFDAADHNLLEIKLQLIEENFKKFVYYNDLVTCVNIQSGKEEAIEKYYIEMKMKIKDKMDCLCTLDNDDKIEDGNPVKQVDKSILPNISLPSFSGDIAQYKSFAETFAASVSENKELTNEQKMVYLKSCLTGTVSDVFDEYPTENYAEILEILRRRYHVSRQQDDHLHGKPGLTVFVNVQDLSEELFKSVMEGSYSHAVQVSKNLYDTNNSTIIIVVAKRLIAEDGAKFMNYIYQLWTENTEIVKIISPIFGWILNQEDVVIKEKHGFALKLSESTDGDGDRHVLMERDDKTSKKVTWKIIPIWENNRVHFNIKNAEYDMYLKLQFKIEDNGDRKAFGSASGDNMRNYWFLKPVLGGKIQFLVINRQFSQVLRSDSDGNKNWQVFGHNDAGVHNDSEHSVWTITPNFKLL